jgi:aryl-alcohol dehydrogenase-like predicted oxidoreductase
MDYRFLGRTGLKVSAACMGGMTFGREIGKDESHAILDAFAEAGGNYLDTADNIYSDGASEEIIGRWLHKRGDRDRWVLATKVCFPTGKAPTDVGLSRKHIFQAIDASLRRLQTDYVDLYQAHWWDNATPIEETLHAFDDLVTAGKARCLGCSNFTAWQIVQSLAVSEAQGLASFAVLQPMYSLLMREPDLELLPVCRAGGLGVVPYSPLARGELTGKHGAADAPLPGGAPGQGRLSDEERAMLFQAYDAERRRHIVNAVLQVAEANRRSPAQVALAWVAQQEGVTAPILGARTVAQLQDNLGFVGFALSEEDAARLDAASRPRQPYPHDYLGWVNGEYKRG